MYRNTEEKVYSEWLDELKAKGFVRDYSYEPFSIQIAPKATVAYDHSLHDLSYTPDFSISWDKSAFGKFYVLEDSQVKQKGLHIAVEVDDVVVSYVDIKGNFANSKNVSAVTFPIIQKVLYHFHGLYINKIKPLYKTGLFHHTFTPVSHTYMKNRIELTKRKTAFKLRSLDDYLKLLEDEPVKKGKRKRDTQYKLL